MRSLLIAIVLTANSLYGQTAREIIDHYLDTVSGGDVKNWEKIKSIYTESKGYYSQQDYEQRFNLLKPDNANYNKAYQVLPYNQKIEIYKDSSFSTLLSEFYYSKNRTVIKLGNFPSLIKPAPTRDEFYSSHLPVQIWKLVQKNESIELLKIGDFPLESFLCYEIKMTVRGRAYLLYIDVQTFLLRYWNGREDQDISILARFDDYKLVNGFLIPMSDSLIKNGITYYSNRVKKYVINPAIDLKIFDYKEK